MFDTTLYYATGFFNSLVATCVDFHLSNVFIFIGHFIDYWWMEFAA